MSVYSRAITDSARCIFTLDSGYTGLAGTQSALASNVTYTGTPATFSHISLSGGNGSFTFNGSTQGLVGTSLAPLGSGSNHTIEAIFKTTYNSATQQFIWSITNGGYLSLNNSNLTYLSANGSYTTTITANASLVNDGQWHHVVCRRLTEGSTTYISLWVDGVKISQSGSFFGSFPNTTTTYVGNIAGSLDFVATYGAGLTDTKIGEHYADFLAAKNSYVEPAILPYDTQISSLNPKVWYKFNETAGTPTNSGSLATTANFISLLLNEQTDVNGRATYFDGTNSYIKIDPWPAFSLFDDKSFTIETWFKLSTLDANDRTLYSFGAFGGATAFIRLDALGNSTANSGKLQLQIATVGEQTADRTTYSPNTYYDNNWHHVVVAFNTTSMKWYIDGQLITIKNLTSGTLNLDSYNTSPGNHRLIGTGKSAISGNLSTIKYRGWLDEFAIYPTELSAADVLKNFNSGASVAFDDMAGFANALFVMPTFSTQTILTASPMTASSASGDHYNSTVEFPTLLNTYMSGLSLQTWFKFDQSKVLTDYGTEPTRSSIWTANATNNPTGGVQGSGELKLIDDGTLVGNIWQQVPITTGAVALVNDEDFTIGFWTKKLEKQNAASRILYFDDDNTLDEISFYWNTDGGITFNIYANNNNHAISSTTDITDGQWHFVAGRLNSSTMELFVDGTSIGTVTMSHTYTLDYLYFDGDNSNDTTSVSQFFISTSANVGSTQISNIWDYGTPQTVQASAYMPMPGIKFNSAFNDYIQSKNPILDYRLDEGSGSPINYGTASISLVPYLSPQGFTQGETGLNTRAFKFTSRDQTTRGNYNLDTGTFSTDDRATIGVLFKNANATNQQGMVGFGGRLTIPGDGNGFSLQQLATSGYLRVLAGNGNGTVTNLTGTTNFADNNWHLAVIVKESSTLRLYVDGKEHASASNSTQMTDNGEFIIGGIAGILAASASRDTLIDEVFVTNTAFTAQEVFEAWRSLRLEMDTTASASLPMPTNIAGTGTIQTATVTTASASLPMSTNSTDQVPTIAPMTASALFVLPNFGGNVVIDANYGHTAFEASALFHMPQYNIGESNSADHMDASALFVHPIAIGGGTITAPTAVALDATFVMPGIVTIKGARVFAEPMRSRAIFPLPPAYVQLADDNWYLRLLQGHADKKIEAVQANLGNLPNQSTTDVVKGGFLSFFDDVLLDITPTTAINSINSEIPAHYFDRAGSYRYDNNGNLLPLDNTKAVARASAPRASITPTPMASVGYFDNQERRALRVENIEFVLPGTSINHSKRPYNLEFSFKTTKANQIIAYGQWNSFLYYGREIGVIGLFDGKIYLADDAYKVWSSTGSASLGDSRRNIAASAPHPKNFTNEYYVPHLLGRKRIDDGQWHHVVIQNGWTDNRTQIWIDGVLDRQIGVLNPELGSGPNLIKGLDGTNSIRPYIIGFNSTDPNLYSDFQTSAWNFYPGRFIEERDLSLNYSAFSKWEPIKPEPMLATINLTDNTKAKGNRPRAIMLYWWETNPNGSLQHKTFDGEPLYNLDTDTFAQLKTQYNDKEPVQKYYGWDIFPIDILGRYRSPLTKEDVIVSAGYRDPVTGAPRYLDIINDLDLSTIDAIFFRNYPDETKELDEFARDEIADTYFGLTERTLYENFVKSLRNALDTGINLYITNHTLAKDLGIIRDAEVVYDLIDQDAPQWNSYPQQQAPVPLPNVSFEEGGGSNFKGWYDTYKNNYLKVINTVPGITDQYGIIRNAVQMYNPSAEEWNQPFRSFASYTQKQNLNVGDTFVISYAPYTPFNAFGNSQRMSIEGYYATHKDNVLAGIPITAFADTYRKNSVETENPYKDYVTSIALPTGTILNGRPIKSRVFVNFTERINGSFEEGSVELIQDEWIDIAFQVGRITAAQRDAYKAASYNLDRQLEAAIAAGNQAQINSINKLKYWDMNGMNMGSSSRVVQGTISDQSAGNGGASGTTATATTGNRAAVAPQPDNPDARGSWSGGVWFKFSFFWQYPIMRIPVSSMLTRGFVWLANRIIDDGTVNRTNVTTASATMVMPVVVGDKDRTVYAQAALANANIIHAPGYALTNVSDTPLPMFANVKFGDFVKNIRPDVMAAEARFRSDILTTAVETDQVVVYVYHVDPIVYLREEVIK